MRKFILVHKVSTNDSPLYYAGMNNEDIGGIDWTGLLSSAECFNSIESAIEITTKIIPRPKIIPISNEKVNQ